MKIVLTLILGLASFASAKPSGAIVTPYLGTLDFAAPVVASGVVAVAPLAVNEISSQFHAQDALGQYTYGYASSLASKAETKTIDGITRGGYTYLDAEGKVQTASYVSDPLNGFRIAATNIPIGPTKNVAPVELAPVQVPDTPEVAAAKATHLAAIEEAKSRVAAANAAFHQATLAKVAALPTASTIFTNPSTSLIFPIPAIATSSLLTPITTVEGKAANPKETEDVTTNLPLTTISSIAENSEKPSENAEVKTSKLEKTNSIETISSALSNVGVVATPSFYYHSNVIAAAPQPATLIAAAPSIFLPNTIGTFHVPALNLVSQHLPTLQVAPEPIGSDKVSSDSVEIVAAKSSEKITASKPTENDSSVPSIQQGWALTASGVPAL